MATWTSDELNKIGTAHELRIAPLRLDGTLRNPVTIWVVCVDADLYVRCYRGPTGAWYQAALVHHAGRIWAGGIEKDVNFVLVSDPGINDQIDAAYRTKYGRTSPYVPPMLTAEVRATTLQLVPR